ncbi:type III secretion system LEE chaperone CesL [Escherichia coli]
MNLLVKRNVEEFLRLLGNDFYLFDNRVEIDFNGFSSFIEIIDNNVFVTFALEYNENAFFSFFSALAPERTQGVIEHIFVYDNKLCLSCLLTNIDVFFLMNTFQQHVQIIERVRRMTS